MNRSHMGGSLETLYTTQSINDPFPSLLLVYWTISYSSLIYKWQCLILNTQDEEYCIQTNFLKDRTDNLPFNTTTISTFNHQSTEEFHFVVPKINEIRIVECINHRSTNNTISRCHFDCFTYGSISAIFEILLAFVVFHRIHSLIFW